MKHPRSLVLTLLFASSALLTACGGNYKEPVAAGATTQLGSQKVTVLDGTVTGGGELRGTGGVLFDSSYPAVREGGSYALDFSLADGGSLTLVSHSDSALGGGWEMEFVRNGAGPGSLRVTISAQGAQRDTLNSGGVDVFAGLDASQPLRLQVDVHNNESPAHALVWSRRLGEDFSEAAALLNTEENDNSPGLGAGTRWGLRLRNAAVSRADLSAPKFEE